MKRLRFLFPAPIGSAQSKHELNCLGVIRRREDVHLSARSLAERGSGRSRATTTRSEGPGSQQRVQPGLVTAQQSSNNLPMASWLSVPGSVKSYAAVVAMDLSAALPASFVARFADALRELSHGLAPLSVPLEIEDPLLNG